MVDITLKVYHYVDQFLHASYWHFKSVSGNISINQFEDGGWPKEIVDG